MLVRVRAGGFVVVAAVTLVLVWSAPASAQSAVGCGIVAGSVALYDVRGTGVGCAAARGVARAWRTTLFADACDDGRFRCTIGRYTCRATPPARVNYRVRCTAGADRVSWEIHAD
jgi:hypothetical protein